MSWFRWELSMFGKWGAAFYSQKPPDVRKEEKEWYTPLREVTADQTLIDLMVLYPAPMEKKVEILHSTERTSEIGQGHSSEVPEKG